MNEGKELFFYIYGTTSVTATNCQCVYAINFLRKISIPSCCCFASKLNSKKLYVFESFTSIHTMLSKILPQLPALNELFKASQVSSFTETGDDAR